MVFSSMPFNLRKKLGLGVGKKKFTKANLAELTNDGCVYELYDKNGKRVYVGRASGGRNSEGKRAYGCKHRLQSYDQKDDYGKKNGHPTKKALRDEGIGFFDYAIMNNKKERRAAEAKLRKLGYKHNHN